MQNPSENEHTSQQSATPSPKPNLSSSCSPARPPTPKLPSPSPEPSSPCPDGSDGDVGLEHRAAHDSESPQGVVEACGQDQTGKPFTNANAQRDSQAEAEATQDKPGKAVKPDEHVDDGNGQGSVGSPVSVTERSLPPGSRTARPGSARAVVRPRTANGQSPLRSLKAKMAFAKEMKAVEALKEDKRKLMADIRTLMSLKDRLKREVQQLQSLSDEHKQKLRGAHLLMLPTSTPSSPKSPAAVASPLASNMLTCTRQELLSPKYGVSLPAGSLSSLISDSPVLPRSESAPGRPAKCTKRPTDWATARLGQHRHRPSLSHGGASDPDIRIFRRRPQGSKRGNSPSSQRSPLRQPVSATRCTATARQPLRRSSTPTRSNKQFAGYPPKKRQLLERAESESYQVRIGGRRGDSPWRCDD